MSEEPKSDTPETENYAKENCLPPVRCEVAYRNMFNFTKKLERERDEARRIAQNLRELHLDLLAEKHRCNFIYLKPFNWEK